jgi:peptidoglycan/xylan/chitin deacetylase (PgdA/CDA1 family)
VAPWPSEAPEEARRLWDLDHATAWLDAGMTIGSHGMHHIDLTTTTPARIRAEVAGSKAALEKAIGPVAAFCYPWGRHHALARAEVRRAGYAYAVGGGYGRSHRSDEVFALRRLTVDHDDTMRDFELKLKGGFDWLDILTKVRNRTRAWW